METALRIDPWKYTSTFACMREQVGYSNSKSLDLRHKDKDFSDQDEFCKSKAKEG